MPGGGGIGGGGGSAWLNFVVNHGDGKEYWNVYDKDVTLGRDKVTITFPTLTPDELLEKVKASKANSIVIDLKYGECVTIKWG